MRPWSRNGLMLRLRSVLTLQLSRAAACAGLSMLGSRSRRQVRPLRFLRKRPSLISLSLDETEGMKNWRPVLGSNQRFLIQSQASYH